MPSPKFTLDEFKALITKYYPTANRIIQWHGLLNVTSTPKEDAKPVDKTTPAKETPTPVKRKGYGSPTESVKAQDTTGNVPASPDADSLGLGTATESD